MASKVESTIVVNIEALVKGLPQVNSLSSEVKGLDKVTGTFSGRATVNLKSVEDGFGRLRTSAQGFAFSVDKAGRSVGNGFVPLSKAGADIKRFSDTVKASEDILSMRRVRAGIAAANNELTKSNKAALANVNNLVNGFRRDDSVRQFQNTLRGVARASREAGQASIFARVAGFNPLAAAGRVVGGVISTLTRQVYFLIAAFALFLISAPGLVLGALVREGLQFNSILEQTKIGMAALIQSTNDLFSKDQPNKPLEGVEKFNAATALAEVAALRLRIKIIPLKATSEELLPIFNQIITSGAAAGLSLEQTEDTFISLAAAAQVLQIPVARLGTEIRLLLAGTTRETSRLGPALFGTAAAARAFVKEHRATGDLFSALQIKLVAYNQSLVKSVSSFATLAENSKEVFQVLAGLATAGLFERIKEGLTLITQGFFDLNAGKLKPEFEALFNFLNSALDSVGKFLVGLLEDIIEWFRDIARYVQNNAQDISNILNDLLNIAIQLGGIVGDVFSIFTDVNKTREETVTWHTILGYVAITLAIIRDALNVIIGIFEIIGGVIAIALIEPLKLVLEILGHIFDQAAKDAKALEDLQQSALTFSLSGVQRIEHGTDATKAAVERFLNPGTINTKRTGTDPADNFIARRRNIPRPADREGQQTENRLGQLKQAIARLERQLADERVETERAANDKLFNLRKQSDDIRAQQLADAHQHELQSDEDFFAEKARLQTAAIELEKQHLRDQFNFDKEKLNNKLGEINDKFNAAKAEPRNKDARIQAQLAREKEIEEMIVLNNFKQKQIELDERLEALDKKAAADAAANIVALNDARTQLARADQDVHASLLDAAGRVADSDIRRIALQNADRFKSFIINETEIAKEKAKELVERIGELGSVTSSELRSLFAELGINLDSLSPRMKALLALVERLENSARRQSFQQAFELRGQRLDIDRQRIQDEIERGVKNEGVGRREIARLEREAKVELQALIVAQEKLLATLEKTDPEYERIRVQLERTKQETEKLGRETDKWAQTLENLRRRAGTISVSIGQFFKDNFDVITGAFDGFIDSVIEGNQSIGDSLRQLAANILKELARIIFQALIAKAILAALGLAGGGPAGGLGASGASAAGGVAGGFAEGGQADIGAEGAIKGPGTGTSDSILAWLSNGEWVVPAARVAQYGSNMMRAITNGTFRSIVRLAAGGPVGAATGGGGASNLSVRNINLFDPELLSSHLNTAHGERAILNIISRNPDAIRRRLGL